MSNYQFILGFCINFGFFLFYFKQYFILKNIYLLLSYPKHIIKLSGYNLGYYTISPNYRPKKVPKHSGYLAMN